jgi:hypothetical protein
MSEQNALLALKNAWNGAVAASDEVRALAPAVAGLSETTPLGDLDRLTFAQANAVMALRGLVEQLRRVRESA